MFNSFLPIILGFEGGFADNKNDPGGRTNKGVVQKTYDDWRKARGWPLQDVLRISNDEVEQIYQGYYKACSANLFDVSHPNTALCQFDCAINQGPGTAKYLLQRAINVCWGVEKIVVDGLIGFKTLAALKDIHDNALLKVFLDSRKNRYLQLIASRPAMSEFKSSWFHRLNKIAQLSELNWKAE